MPNLYDNIKLIQTTNDSKSSYKPPYDIKLPTVSLNPLKKDILNSNKTSNNINRPVSNNALEDLIKDELIKTDNLEELLGSSLGKGKYGEVFEYSLDSNLVIKVFNSDYPLNLVYDEFQTSKALEQTDLNIPSAVDIIKSGNHFAIVYEKCSGKNVFQEAIDNPQSLGTSLKDMAQLQASLSKCTNPNFTQKRPSQMDIFKSSIEQVNLYSDERKNRAYSLFKQLPERSCLCHGDFHPENIIITNQGLKAIDWANSRIGNPTADLARTLLSIEYMPMPQELAEKFNGSRKELAEFYFNEYIKNIDYPLSLEEVAKWKIIVSIDILCTRQKNEFLGESDKELILSIIDETLDKYNI